MSDLRNIEKREQIKENLAEDLNREPTNREIDEVFWRVELIGFMKEQINPEWAAKYMKEASS
jgi:hypothetical protein|tara:strand:- start:640 stop:825 length:186 start_codon:yes stop_codon:yes gene_type:complete